MHIGSDYYPEHWPRERWKTDAKLMQEAGFNVVRLAEFAWVNMEPREGAYEFGWLDEALQVLHAHGIKAILCTPTAVMPAWLARKYPEALASRADGSKVVWGVRKNNCFTAGAYRLLSERITRAMAEHFRDTPNVIGWQTDNEFSGSADYFCHCHTCRMAFQDWLRSRHGDLETLNRRMGLHFWGHLARTWADITIPQNMHDYNPGICLEYHRFTSDLNVQFQRDQVKILRAICPDHFVTHNLMGWAPMLNYWDLAEDLDFVAWDNYPVRNEEDEYFGPAAAADIMRGMKRKNFWIMEQTAGPAGWGSFGRNPRPGEIRKVAYQQLAHGCDGQVWFRWRTCSAGREQYWHGLLQHDGEPLRRYDEAARTAKEYRKLWDILKGTTVKSRVAFIYDYDSLWALQKQPGYGKSDYREAFLRYYRACLRTGVNTDVIPPAGDFDNYQVIVAPHLYVLPDAVAKRLTTFVRAGGILLTDCRTAAKDEWSLMHERTLPGLLSDCLGIRIAEYESLESPNGGNSFTVMGQGDLKGEYTCHLYADWLTPTTAETLAEYTGQWHLEPFAAATRNAYGRGHAYYVGTILKEDAFYDALVNDALTRARIKPAVRPPEGVEASIREARDRRILFLINHTEECRTVNVAAGKTELLSGQTTTDTLKIPRLDVAVIEL